MNRKQASLWLLALLVATFVVFAPSLGNLFTMDDRLVAKAVFDTGRPNPMIHEPQPIWRYFGSHYWYGSFESDTLYRPVTVMSYAYLYRAFGRGSDGSPPSGRGAIGPSGRDATEAREALPQHLMNVLLQLVATWLVYRMLRAFPVGRVESLLGSAVFALHSIHSEVIAGIIGRAELLAFCFGAGALLLEVSSTPKGSALRRAGAALLLFLAFCSKESALAWVPFLFVFRLAREFRSDWSSTWRRPLVSTLIVSALPLIVFFVLRQRMIANLPSEPQLPLIVNPLSGEPASVRVTSGVMLWGYGLYMTLFPFSLASDYGVGVFRFAESILDYRFLAALLALGLLLVSGVAALRRQPLLFLAMASFLGFGFITSNIPFATGTVFAERLYYTPSVGLSFLVAWLARHATSVPARRWPLLAAPLTLWVMLCCWVILERNTVWHDNKTLNLHEIEVQPNSARIHLCVADLYTDGIFGDHRDRDARKFHLERAIELFPGYATAWNRLAQYWLEQERLDKAEECLRSGLAVADRDMAGTGYWLHSDLAGTLLAGDRVEEAKTHLTKAMERKPAVFLKQRLDGLLEHEIGRLDYAWLRNLLDRGEDLLPSEPAWALYRGLLAQHHADWTRAEPDLRRAVATVRGHPRHAEARFQLGSTLLRLAKKTEGERVLEELSLDPGVPQQVREEAAKLRRRSQGR